MAWADGFGYYHQSSELTEDGNRLEKVARFQKTQQAGTAFPLFGGPCECL